MPTSLVIIGVGGHSKVVAEAAALSGKWQSVQVMDTRKSHSFPSPQNFVVALGDNALRESLQKQFTELGWQAQTVVHPSAIISPSAQMGSGCVVCAGAIVGVDAQLGDGCIVNTAASVDHDCQIGNFVHIAPGVHLAGGVSVGDRSLLGVASFALPSVKIAEDVVLGGVGQQLINWLNREYIQEFLQKKFYVRKVLKIMFLGRKKYAAQALEWLLLQGFSVVCVVADDSPCSPLQTVAQKYHCPVFSITEAEQKMKEDSGFANLAISYLYGKKIQHPLIEGSQYGCINFHPAILPDWKGVGGYNMAILHKLREWGASAHYVDENIDTGAIIQVSRFVFDSAKETAFSLAEKTQSVQFDLFKQVMNRLTQEPSHRLPTTPNVGGIYVSKKELLKMMEVNTEKDDIDLKCRAFWFPPYSGATAELQGKRYTLVSDEILQGEHDA